MLQNHASNPLYSNFRLNTRLNTRFKTANLSNCRKNSRKNSPQKETVQPPTIVAIRL